MSCISDVACESLREYHFFLSCCSFKSVIRAQFHFMFSFFTKLWRPIVKFQRVDILLFALHTFVILRLCLINLFIVNYDRSLKESIFFTLATLLHVATCYYQLPAIIFYQLYIFIYNLKKYLISNRFGKSVICERRKMNFKQWQIFVRRNEVNEFKCIQVEKC